jgi:hypothetical protein
VSVKQIQADKTDWGSHKREPKGEKVSHHVGHRVVWQQENNAKGKAKTFEANKPMLNQQASGSFTSGFPVGIKGCEEKTGQEGLLTLKH